MIPPTYLRRLLATFAVAGVVGCSGETVDRDAGAYPAERLRWTIPFGPGGGNDRMARTLIDIIDLYGWYPEGIEPSNRVGGSGAQGWGWVFARRGDPYQITTISGSFLTLPFQAGVPWTPSDFTPVALMASDDAILVVGSDSAPATFEAFLRSARDGPVAVGGVGALNSDVLTLRGLAREAGFTLRYVSFNGFGALSSALLSGAVDVVVTSPGEAIGLLRAGTLRGIAYAGAVPPAWMSDVPTFEELGYGGVVVSMPRGVVLAPEVEPAVQEWWIDTMRRVAATPEWATYLESAGLRREEVYGEEFGRALARLGRVFQSANEAEGR
ncbi:MAG: tripartite tricarboxylate transporter substrate binding protein [Gemmatimonadota bacterium]